MQKALQALLGTEEDRALAATCILLIAYGIALRSIYLGSPAFSWDEHHFVENARHYSLGLADQNDHPPLGKLLIAASIGAFGDHGFAWRLVPLCFGFASIALAYLVGSKLFRDYRAGWIAASLVAIDGFFISYSRAALLDGMIASLVLATAALLAHARKSWHIAAASVLVGLTASIKFSGVVMAVPVAVVSAGMGRAPRWSAVFLALVPAVYVSVYAYGLGLSGRPNGVADVYDETRRLVTHHLGLTDMKHPDTSYWYTWFLPLKPILHRATDIGEGRVRITTTLGNPLLWWATTSAVAYGVVRIAAAGVVWLRTKLGSGGAGSPASFAPTVRAIAFLLMFWSLPVLPWIVSERDSYINHYLPAYGFAVILVAGGLASWRRRRPVAALAALLLVAEVSAFYGPVWSYRVLSRTAANHRLFLPTWR